MTIKIKNCGMKTPETIAVAVRARASFIGFVHHAASPRHLAFADIESLAHHVPHDVARVIVTTNPDDTMLDALRSFKLPDFLQVHGVDDPKRLAQIQKRIGIPLITAIHVTPNTDFSHLKTVEDCSAHLLFDAAEAGSGQSFDWTLLRNELHHLNLQKPWFLAGGLRADNVAQAIAITGAPMVDVSSGIESTRGEKSEEMIAAFNAAVLNAS